MDQTTFEITFKPDPEQKRVIRFLVAGEELSLPGLTFARHPFGTDDGERIHLLGTDNLGRDVFSRMIWAALAEVQMEPDAMDRFPNEFSGGQRQRIAIAGAIILRPNSILLDEPTSALDLSMRAQIIDQLRDLRRKQVVRILSIAVVPRFWTVTEFVEQMRRIVLDAPLKQPGSVRDH